MFHGCSTTIAVASILSLFLQAEGWAPNTAYVGSSRCGKHSFDTRLAGEANDFNVVLRPSEDHEAFDSFKIGSAKVHRYSLDTDPDSETEYVMYVVGGKCLRRALCCVYIC
jgi:hypothetical protein